MLARQAQLSALDQNAPVNAVFAVKNIAFSPLIERGYIPVQKLVPQRVATNLKTPPLILESELDGSRFEHSFGVSRRAPSLSELLYIGSRQRSTSAPIAHIAMQRVIPPARFTIRECATRK